ncbi:MAG: hypothetical protein DMG14_13770 [Acidobacteria bacterium]|nr:MAG: hypothetical protein DMG14_13770 [Acidobacteriota bacterium]
MADVIVVGGGPAGLHAAYLLGKEGFDVRVLEEHSSIGSPVHCTGIVAAEAFKEFDIQESTALHPLHNVRFYAPSGTSFEYRTRDAEVFVIDRRSFDQQLCDRAVAAGVTVTTSSKVFDIRTDDQRALVVTSNGECFQCRIIVLACGADYVLQRRLGLGVPNHFLQSAQIETRSDLLDAVEIHTGKDIAPGGFGWAVPVIRNDQSYVRLGLMCASRVDHYFANFRSRIGKQWNLESSAIPRRKILPLGPIPKTFGNRIIAVGDAAGIVKPTTGGGIYYGLVSASIAARTVTAGLRSNDISSSFLAQYDKAWRNAFQAEIESQLMFRKLATRLNDTEIDQLVALAKYNGLRPLIRMTARFNHQRTLINAVLGHPGARRILLKELFS